jgi:hypothetical protein
MIDYVVILITALIGGLGWHVTLHPPAPTKKKRYYALFLVLTSTGIILSGVQARRNGQIQDQILGNTSQPAIFTLLTPQQVFPLASGQKCIFNINFRNGGPVATKGEGRVASLSFISQVLSTPQDQNDLEQRFKQFWQDPKSQIFHLAVMQPGGGGMVSTTRGPVITDEDAQSLQSGGRAIYILTRLAYTDKFGSHTQDFCQMSQPPMNTVTGPMTMFHYCPFGNSDSQPDAP